MAVAALPLPQQQRQLGAGILQAMQMGGVIWIWILGVALEVSAVQWVVLAWRAGPAAAVAVVGCQPQQQGQQQQQRGRGQHGLQGPLGWAQSQKQAGQ